MVPSNACLFEMKQLNVLAADYLEKGNRAKHDELRKKAERLGSVGLSTEELQAKFHTAQGNDIEARYSKAFRRWFKAGGSKEGVEARELEKLSIELRDFLAGTQTISWTLGAQGGFTVDIDTYEQVIEGLAQTDALFDPDVCSFVRYDAPYMKPLVLNGYDLSSISSTNIQEGQQQTAGTIPVVSGRTLRSNNAHRVTLASSYEFDQDAPDPMGKIARAMAVGFARGVGKEIIIGNGTTQALGLFTSLGPATVTIGTGVEDVGGQSFANITYKDLTNLYFSLNRVYRAQPRCAWLCNDSVYQKLRNVVDNMGRPLLSIKDDEEQLFDKPIHISPSLTSGTFQSLSFGALIFGDLSHFFIHMARPTLQRSIENSINGIERGEALWRGMIRFDSALFDPTQGSVPPIIWAAVHS